MKLKPAKLQRLASVVAIARCAPRSVIRAVAYGFGNRPLRKTSRIEPTRLVLAGIALLIGSVALAENPESADNDASSVPPQLLDEVTISSHPLERAPQDDVADAFRLRASKIRQLMAGALPVSDDPALLFEIPLNDEAAVSLEAERLRLLLQAAGSTRSAPALAEVDGSELTAGDETSVNTTPESPRLAARLEFDQAQLEFFSLSPSERSALLDAHRNRQEADTETRALQASREAEKRAEAAAAERERVLAGAERARTEAQRLVAEERARLLGVASEIAGQQAELARSKNDLAVRIERTLALRRAVREALAGPSTSTDVDGLYQDVRRWLRTSRDELAEVMAQKAFELAAQSQLAADPLRDLPIQIDRSEIDTLRDDSLAAIRVLSEQSAEFKRQHTEQVYADVLQLNEDRLALLPRLSPDLRDAITGFGSAGVDQALAELRQLALILEFHVRWLGSDAWRAWPAETAGTVTAVVVKSLLILAIFVWVRAVVEKLLLEWRARVREQARSMRTLQSGRLDETIGFLLRILNPVAGLLLVVALVATLPIAVSQLMEVQLVVAILKWTLGGWLAVVTLDSLAMRRASGGRRRYRRASNDALRLRSLRLVGMAVVTFGLILSMTRQIVGTGTIYTWVLRTCWWTALPIGLVIVYWWRDEIFRRIERLRRKNWFESWVLASRGTWRSLIAATLAGLYLFVAGGITVVSSWLGELEVTRRVMAYVFRQHIDRIAERQETGSLASLPAEAFDSLSPSTPSDAIISFEDSADVSTVIEHIDRSAGGVFAVVGERGSGRSTMLKRVRESRTELVLVDCPFEGLGALTAAMASALEMQAKDSLEVLATHLDAQGDRAGIIIDNAHRLVRPVMGGLAAFDRLIDCARQHSTNCAWVISIDSVTWRFYGRSRSVDTLFDEVVELEEWPEKRVGALLKARTAQAGLQPAYDRLLPGLRPDRYVDDMEREEIQASAEASYHRLIWDYAAGNPGVALHVWRTSLGIAADGAVYVTPFRVPDAAAFDALPDTAIFMLRAVLQLERARAADVAEATRVPLVEVENALRYGVQCGYLTRITDRYAMTWNWYRPITRFLRRRHLLPNG
jgi:hypothetical protein